ncbi:NAD-dependent deacetylase [Filimonas lacunae]|uniref:protein acetyllysine N-acetyltransferase n=1 Tax=Filimonas lacunae TaxID=477680 RepID=A0A173MFX5_9BACT|nr:NAD-dependent deacylase [Filimonas lacunae]BAV06377.1 NAD-dependent protein deacetylase of SIR2 family [Filimonas lacunae]SIT26698.1 NAD-dependent deacetylase [Filimonas lacunae]
MTKKKLVILTGAGISAESGLKTFRDNGGLWEGHKPQEVANPRAWQRNPKMVLDFYNFRRSEVLKVQPNAAHIGLAELQDQYDMQIITQNVDDLHERAGSRNVLHLHGEIFKMRSVRNENKIYDITGDINLGDKAEDGGQLRPHIVWFEEPVPLITKAAEITSEADIFVVIGTSLVVYPAAGLLDYTQPGIPVFILDKSIPEHRSGIRITTIEAPATEGIEQLKTLLAAL